MRIDFATLQGLTIPEGVVTQIADSSGRVLWKLETSKPIVLEVEKITSDTYAGETLYTGEQFILLDIYPKTNGTVTVTYGGLTKTITDTSGAEEPNAQQVFFGTFNGVSDSVTTPASGTLTIEGDCRGFGGGAYDKTSKDVIPVHCACITEIVNFGDIEYIPDYAFCDITSKLTMTTIEIPKNVSYIGTLAFADTSQLQTVTISENVAYIGHGAFAPMARNSDLITVNILGTTPAETGINEAYGHCNLFGDISSDYFTSPQIIVPKGCGSTYKTAEGWSYYADYIVEVS